MRWRGWGLVGEVSICWFVAVEFCGVVRIESPVILCVARKRVGLLGGGFEP